MISIFIGILVIAGLLLAFGYLLSKFKDSEVEEKEYLPYVKKNYLMTEAEHNFYKVLEEVVQGKYHIIPQVQLSNIVRVNRYEKNKYGFYNRIDRKSVDFVLFDKATFSPYLVIELDDESHQLPKREERDRFVDEILAKVGLRIVHVRTAYNYDIDALRTLIGNHII